MVCRMKRLGSPPAWLLWAALGLGLLLSCGTSATFIVQQYDGPALPAERIAILRLEGGDEGYLATLDGETLDYRVESRTDRIHIEMLPGRHELGLALKPLGLISYRVFQAQAGRIYHPKIVRGRLERRTRGQPEWTAAVFEVDPESGELLRDVSNAPLPTLPESTTGHSDQPVSSPPPPAPTGTTPAPTSTAPAPGTTPNAPEPPSTPPTGPAPSAPEPPSTPPTGTTPNAPEPPSTPPTGPVPSAPEPPSTAPTPAEPGAPAHAAPDTDGRLPPATTAAPPP